MNDVGLSLFHRLVIVGNAMEAYRDTHALMSDAWTAMTDILGLLDEAIDLLVESRGLENEDEEDL